jgi:DNA-binding GntR family transcriptional regulator
VTGAASGRTGPGQRPRHRTRGAGAIERKSIVQMAAEALREKILRGEYAEGAALRQDAIAAQLGVSRIPVREALRQLEAEGLVSFSPHHGAVVPSLSLPEIEELFELRALLESDLLRKAVPHIDAPVLARAAKILDDYDDAFDRRDIATWGTLNWAFHATLLAAAGYPLTLGVLANLHSQSERYMRLQLSLTHGERRASDEHHAILAAAAAGDADRAARLLARHIIGVGVSVREFLRVQRGGG